MKYLSFLSAALFCVACGDVGEPEEMCGAESVLVSLLHSTTAACGEARASFEVVATGHGSVEYSVDGVNFQSSGEFKGLKPEKYVVTARDEAQCLGKLEVVLESSDEISFSQTIKPIVEANCALADCHVAAAQAPDLSVEANIFSAAPRIKRQVETGAMPFGDDRTLPDAQIEEIICWFVNGARNN